MKLLIVHPWMPQYRVQFMLRLQKELAARGIDVTIAHGEPTGHVGRRGDSVIHKSMIAVPTKELSVFGKRSFVHRNIGRLVRELQPDAIIVEQAIKNLENWILLLSSRFRGVRLAFWGHGRSYSTKQTRFESSLKQWMTKRGSWFFAYTQGGADYVIEHSFSASRVTVVNNSIDMIDLKDNISRLSPHEIEQFRKLHSLIEGKTALYLGGIDSAKGIPFLLDAVQQLVVGDPAFRLLVVGDGELTPDVLTTQADCGSVRYLGAQFGSDKAMSLAAADVLMIPQQIGLVALDSLAAGRPIVTATASDHGPEFDYLSNGETVVIAKPGLSAYVEAVRETLADPRQLQQLQRQCRLASEHYSLEKMIENFANGATNWLNP